MFKTLRILSLFIYHNFYAEINIAQVVWWLVGTLRKHDAADDDDARK